ncbi:MAG: hypothetical protein K0U41_07500 [Gammaproteobacteria bacterium]|nr:hypothetical protein [Gammaproteobacteria bacterium]
MLNYSKKNKNLTLQVLILVSAMIFSSSAYAGKFYFNLGYNFDESTFSSAELSLSSGGNYASTVDLGGTYFFNSKGMQLLSFDVFSSLDSVQDYNFLFAAGVRVLLLSANFEQAGGEGGKGSRQTAFGLMPGMDMGYRFETRVPTVLLWSLDYAPNLLTSNQLEEVLQTGLFYEIMFTPIVIGSLSYRYSTASFSRNLDASVPDSIRKFENTLGLGIKIRF